MHYLIESSEQPYGVRDIISFPVSMRTPTLQSLTHPCHIPKTGEVRFGLKQSQSPMLHCVTLVSQHFHFIYKLGVRGPIHKITTTLNGTTYVVF